VTLWLGGVIRDDARIRREFLALIVRMARDR
jgi:hypothetical protein